jgi:hypothetical protein
MTRAGAVLVAFTLLTWPARACFAAESDGHVLQTFEVRDHFGVSHPMQIVDFDLDLSVDPSAVHVLDGDGRPVPFQVIDGGKKLAVETDLPAHRSRSWKLVRGPSSQVSPSNGVMVREYTEDGRVGYEITNGLTGVRVPAPTIPWSARWRPRIDLMSYRPDAPRVVLPAPVQGILYRDGRWSGTGPNALVLLANRFVGMHTRFLERGPLKVVVEVVYAVEHQEYKFGPTVLSPAGRGYYTCTMSVLAGQPSILFEEDTDLEMTWSTDLYPGLHPTNARYRGHHAEKKEYGYEPDGRALRPRHERTEDVDAQVDLRYDKPVTPSYRRTETTWRPMAVWDPWAANTGWYWQLFDARAGADSNVVGIFAGPASRAISPGMSGVWIYTLPATKRDAPAAGISVGSYRRGPDGHVYPRSRFQWGLFVGTKGEDLKEPTAVQPINLQMNLHGGFNLNKIRRYTLDFPDPPGGYGALYMDREAVESLKDKLRQDRSGPHGKGIHAYLFAADPRSHPLLDMWADPTGGKVRDAVAAVSKTATDMLNAFVNGAGIYDFRFHYWHGGLEMMRLGMWIDQILADPRATEAQKREVKAAAVLFANILWDNDFVPMDNYDGINLGTANMPVQQAAYRHFYALLLARHPDMAERARRVEAEVRGTVRRIINEHGAEIGSPHYVGASFEPTLTSLLQVKQLGREDPFKAETRLAKFAEFFMNLLTPPEPRVGGKRAFISVGDSSTEPSELFGLLGTGFRDANADLSARLMGAWRANGRPHSFFFGTTLLMIDESLPAADPGLGDANFPGYYSVLRDGWGTPNETALWFVNGDFYSDHRHDDHGSVVIYALDKPLSIDWGSLGTPRVPGAYMHSGVVLEKAIGRPWDQDSPPLSSGGRWSNSTQHVFATFKEGAYARASFRAGNTVWMRSVLSIHADAAHPVLVIRDSFAGEGRDEPKVLSLNLMAVGPVETPAGPVTPEPRRYPVSERQPGVPGELPSASRPFELAPGVNRLGFTGKFDVDWDVYTIADHAEQALIGDWAVTPWGGAMTDKEERQHILRIRGSGPFTTVILPWRRGARPTGLSVRRDGEAVVIKAEDSMVRIERDGYTYAGGAGSVRRRVDRQAD